MAEEGDSAQIFAMDEIGEVKTVTLCFFAIDLIALFLLHLMIFSSMCRVLNLELKA